MITWILAAGFVAAWCLAPLPVAVAVGRAFRAGATRQEEDEVLVTYEAAGA